MCTMYMAINALLRYPTRSNNLSVVIIINFSVVVLKAYRLIFMPTATAKTEGDFHFPECPF